jgi:thiol-disulfide isomerase/thioredoxin
MKRFLLTFSVMSFSMVAFSQSPKEPASEATLRYDELQQDIQARRRGAGADDESRLDYSSKNLALQVKFIEAYPTSPEANHCRLHVARLATSMANDPEAIRLGKKALADFDLSLATMPEKISLLSVARKLGGEDAEKELFQRIYHSAKTTEEKMTFLVAHKTSVSTKKSVHADPLLENLQSLATSDEDKAIIQLGLADIAYKLSHNKSETEYKAMLSAIVTQYPNTKSGALASKKVTAFELKPGDDILHFSSTDPGGNVVSTADYKGKVLLIDFWSTGCMPCIAEIPEMISVYQEYHDQGFDILGVSLDSKTARKDLIRFLEKRKIPWKQAFEGKGFDSEAAKIYNVKAMPTLILVGKDGKVFTTTNLRGDDLGKEVKKALEAK